MTTRSIGILGLAGSMVTTALGAQAGLLDRPARLHVQSVTLEEALVQLARDAGVPIAFSNDLVRDVYPVACSCDDVTVGQALDSLLARTGLEYREMRQRIVVRPGVGSGTSEGDGGGSHIVGVVLGKSDGRPIASASVSIAGQGGAVLTDARGHFRLPIPPGSYDVIARAIGYRPSRVDAVRLDPGLGNSLTIALDPAPVRLADIVVTPSTYGILTDRGVIATHTLSREDVQTRPHLGEDVFRTVDRLPGVATHDITAKFHVRGGPYEQVLTTLDGLELIEPFHLKDADAALSIIDVESVSSVDLITGGFSAEYGDKLTGVFALETMGVTPERTETTLGLSIQNVTFKNQGSFAAKRGSWLVSARRGYLDLVLDLTNAQKEGASFSPTFYDVFAKGQYLAGGRHRVSVQTLYAGDNVESREEDGTVLESSWSSGYAWLNWDADLTADLSARTVLSVGRLTRKRIGADFDDADQVLAVDDHQVFDFAGIKQDWRFLAGDDVLFKWGAELKHGASDYDYARWSRTWMVNTTDSLAPPWFLSSPDTLHLVLAPFGQEVGAYLSGRVRPWEPFVVEVGARYDHQSHTGDHSVAPRVNAALRLGAATTLRGAWGYYYQSHGVHELRVADGEREFGPAQRAEHRILGVQRDLREGLTLRLEAYERRIKDPLPEFRSLVPEIETVPEEGPEDRVRIAPTRVVARGIEASLRYDDGGRWTAWVSYVLAAARDEVEGRWLPRPFDQRHTVQVEAAYHPTPRWSFSWAWQYHSPWPGTPEAYQVVPLPTGSEVLIRSFGELYGNQMPAYHRLDARVQRHFTLGRGTLSVFIDVFNLYDRKNALAWDYVPDVGTRSGLRVQRNFHSMIGVLPAIGARWQF